jgi:hypothetical protein
LYVDERESWAFITSKLLSGVSATVALITTLWAGRPVSAIAGGRTTGTGGTDYLLVRGGDDFGGEVEVLAKVVDTLGSESVLPRFRVSISLLFRLGFLLRLVPWHS